MSAEAIAKRRQLGAATVLLGVDRLDYTKGIAQRITAFGELLDEGRLDPGECVMVQVAVPTRVAVEAYCDERAQVEAAVQAVNNRHRRTNGSNVIHFLHENLNVEELASWYRAADVMMVTPLADGMNLVAKEFVASRSDNGGALVLSEFAGVANELGVGAELVNPYDTESIKKALLRAAHFSVAERQSRMRSMRLQVSSNNVDRWASSFLDQLDEPANRQTRYDFRRSVAAHR